MDVVYHGPPDWQFLTRFVSRDNEAIGWPFLIGELIVSTDSTMCAWTPYNSSCPLSIDFLSRSTALDRPRKFLANLIRSAKDVQFEPPPWEEFELVSRFPRIKLVGLAPAASADGKTTGLFVKWGYGGGGIILPRVPETSKTSLTQ